MRVVVERQKVEWMVGGEALSNKKGFKLPVLVPCLAFLVNNHLKTRLF